MEIKPVTDNKTLMQCYITFKNSIKFKLPDYLKTYSDFQNAIAMSQSKPYAVIENGEILLYIRYKVKDLAFEILDLYLNRSKLKLQDVFVFVRELLLDEGYYPFIVYHHTKKNKIYIVFHDFNNKFVIKVFKSKEEK